MGKAILSNLAKNRKVKTLEMNVLKISNIKIRHKYLLVNGLQKRFFVKNYGLLWVTKGCGKVEIELN